MIASYDFASITTLLVTLIISLTVHEAAHALVGKLGGDLTAYHGGQVTLNPIPHMRREPFGMVILPVASVLLSQGSYCFGFAHAPYDPVWAHHHPRKAALMSAAGPMANVLLAAVAFAILYAIGRPGSDTQDAVYRIAQMFLLLNVLLALFNFVPLPPLDGAGILQGLVPATRGFYGAIARIPNMGIIVLVALFYLFPDYVFYPAMREVVGWLPYWKPY